MKFGARALKWRRRFTGLLPEVQKRRLYENLRNRFEDKPVLKGLLESGEVSVNKLARVVSVATPENEEELAEKVSILPREALETLVRDHKAFVNGSGNTKQNDLHKALFDDKSLHVQTFNFQISDEVAA